MGKENTKQLLTMPTKHGIVANPTFREKMSWQMATTSGTRLSRLIRAASCRGCEGRRNSIFHSKLFSKLLKLKNKTLKHFND